MTRVRENLSAIEDFCSRLEVVPYGAKAAQHYGAIRAAHRGKFAGLNRVSKPGHTA